MPQARKSASNKHREGKRRRSDESSESCCRRFVLRLYLEPCACQSLSKSCNLLPADKQGLCGILQHGGSDDVRMSIAPNPSHLEAVGPVVLGMVAAEQVDPCWRNGPKFHLMQPARCKFCTGSQDVLRVFVA